LLIVAIDGRGNELIAIGSPDASDIPPATVKTGARVQRRPWYGQWYSWAAVAGVTAGAGVYFGWRVKDAQEGLEDLNANSSAHYFAEAHELERRGKRDAVLANVGFGLAGAATVAAVWCGLRGSTRQPTTTVEPVASRGGAGLLVRGWF
jgi:hypothetical protein